MVGNFRHRLVRSICYTFVAFFSKFYVVRKDALLCAMPFLSRLPPKGSYFQPPRLLASSFWETCRLAIFWEIVFHAIHGLQRRHWNHPLCQKSPVRNLPFCDLDLTTWSASSLSCAKSSAIHSYSSSSTIGDRDYPATSQGEMWQITTSGYIEFGNT